jgi:perosamine synthetase
MAKVDLTRRDLALNGGKPLRTKGWSDNFTTGEEEVEAAARAIRSGYLSLFEGSFTPDAPFSFKGGPEVQKLEKLWRDYYGCRHAISVNSATSGLFMAMGAAGVGYGDEVIVSPYTMSACALAPLIYGAIPVFADVEAETGCLDPDSIEKLISPNTKAILVVHQFGIPADMDRIMDIAGRHGLIVVEDCAQAHAALYKGRYVGTIGHIGVFSLNVNKTIQSGEGGVCVTDDDDLAYRLQLIRNHGEAVVGLAGYEEITNIAGFNYRMTEVTAAIAAVQIGRLDKLNTARMELVQQMNEGLASLGFLRPLKGRNECSGQGCCHATYYIYPMRFDSGPAGCSRKEFVDALNAEGLMMAQGYVRPLYLQPLYQRKHLFKNGYPFSAPENLNLRQAYDAGTCPVTERLHFQELISSEHIRPPHDASDIDDILKAIRKVAGV